MPNYCYNTLHVVGAPELIEEFRILNSQFAHATPEYRMADGWYNPALEPDRYPSAHLVAPRKYRDLTFSSLLPNPSAAPESGVALWGAKWDLANDCHSLEPLDRHPLALRNGEVLARSFSVAFDTANNPPTKWFDALRARFPQLTLAMSSVEQDNDLHAVWLIEAGEESDLAINGEDRDAPARAARKAARAAMPPKGRLTPLQVAIAEGDVAGVQRNIAEVDENGLIGGLWPPIFYAAKAGSESVFAWLLTEFPEHVNHQTATGIKVTDLLLDLYPNQRAELVSARYRMAPALAEQAPHIWRQPLASGVTPAELSARYAMTPILDTLTSCRAVLAKGNLGGWARQIAADVTSDSFDEMLARVGPKYGTIFADNAARKAAELNDVALLEKALEANPTPSETTHEILCGGTPMTGGEKAKPDFTAAYLALRAKLAMASTVLKARASVRGQR